MPPSSARHTPQRVAKTRAGQSLVEFAIVLPLLLVLTGGIIQIGAIIATKHNLIQVGRDVGRWAATQAADPCWELADENQPAVRADEIAQESGLMGYVPGTWTSNSHSYGSAAMPSSEPTMAGAEVAWTVVSAPCPPEDSTTAAFVTIRLAHEAPVLVPGLDLVLAVLPGVGSDGVLLITTTAQFRMEPQAEAAESAP